MAFLIVGVLLWTAVHYFKRLLPDVRARLGDPGKGVVAVGVILSVMLMVYGYRTADFIPIWNPPGFLVHMNNTLMLLAFWFYATSGGKGPKVWPANTIRHPQLMGFQIWAVAHLLVNGDLASMILFGGLFVWAAGSIALINNAQPEWTPPETADASSIVRLLIITGVVFLIVSGIHVWLGVWPFGR